MSFDVLWNFVTYIFRIFKSNRQPEYTKVNDGEDLEYGSLPDYQEPKHLFFCNLKL